MTEGDYKKSILYIHPELRLMVCGLLAAWFVLASPDHITEIGNFIVMNRMQVVFVLFVASIIAFIEEMSGARKDA
jgi:hypothetical protein